MATCVLDIEGKVILLQYIQIKIELGKFMKRYQDCNLFIRLYRRLKYQPLYFIKAILLTYRTHKANNDLPVMFVFDLLYCKWYIKANWLYEHKTLEEDE